MAMGNENERRAVLEALEQQLLQLLNSIRQELGKPPIIIPKMGGQTDSKAV
jgi:hypothetical protein